MENYHFRSLLKLFGANEGRQTNDCPKSKMNLNDPALLLFFLVPGAALMPIHNACMNAVQQVLMKSFAGRNHKPPVWANQKPSLLVIVIRQRLGPAQSALCKPVTDWLVLFWQGCRLLSYAYTKPTKLHLLDDY